MTEINGVAGESPDRREDTPANPSANPVANPPAIPAGTTQAPAAKKEPKNRTFHGRTFVDEYEWLRDKENPEVLAHLAAEEAYTVENTKHLKPLSDAIFNEVKSRVQETDMSLPVRSGDWWYFSRSTEGKDYPAMCRIPVSDPSDWTPPVVDPDTPSENEQVFFDCNVEAEGYKFFSLGAASVTLDGTRLAYSVDTAGDERFTMRFRDLTTGEEIGETIPDVFYGATWVGNDTVYYQKVDAAWRPHEVWRHTLGTSVDNDELIFREDDEKFWAGVGRTRSERYLMFASSSKVTSEIWYLDLEDPAAELTCALPREKGVEYGLDHVVVDGEDYWLVTHNKNGVNSELGYHPVGPISSLADVTPLVPHRDDARIEGIDCFQNHVVLEVREDAVSKSYLMNIADGWSEFHKVDFGEPIATVGAAGNSEWNPPVLRFVFTSFTTPTRVYEIDLATGEQHLRREQEVLPDPDGRPFNPADYKSERMWTTATDGTEIPVSLISRADVDLTKENPVLLYGYGSYESSMDPGFSVFRLSMMDRGVVYAIAHVRGGGEKGRLWYDHGKELTKKNTFTDFIAVADDLISRGMTSPSKMVAEGGSAGGMLMGAVANMAGDRFAGIEAIVPFVDPLTSMLMPELPLTITEWEEWGDPLHEPAVYDYMAEYAPYENITADKTYPPILAVTSLNDTRVLYVEPAKWVAKLRDVAGANVLLKIDMESGHGGVSGRYKKWEQGAFETAWELDRMGATELLPPRQ